MAAHCLVRVFANQHASCEIHIEEKQLDIPEPKSINLKVADCRASILSWVEAWPAVGGGPTIIILSGLISDIVSNSISCRNCMRHTSVNDVTFAMQEV